MAYVDYKDGQRLELDVLKGKHTFNGLVQALMRMHSRPDEIKAIFPEVHAELLARYNAPGGLLEGEKEGL